MINEAIEQASDFVIVTDSQSHAVGGPRIVYANRALFEATGFEPEDLLGKSYTTIYSKNNDPKLMAAIRDAIEAGKPNYREMLAARKDGSDFWIEFVAKPFTVEDATFRMSIGRDITTRKRTFNQIALLFSAFEQSANRVALYEPNEAGELAASYENEPAIAAGSHRLLDLWRGPAESACAFRERLLAGESVQRIYAESDASGVPAVVELIARGVRNGNELGAVLTIERVLARADGTEGYSSRLITFARLLPALAEANTTIERFSVLRALLLDTFAAEVEAGQPSTGSGVHIAPGSNTAHFTFSGTSYIARWAKALEPSSLTALRFCIEAAIEQEHVATR
jgi:PAS domain S-box-containing protein